MRGGDALFPNDFGEDLLLYKLTAKSGREKILIIGQHLAADRRRCPGVDCPGKGVSVRAIVGNFFRSWCIYRRMQLQHRMLHHHHHHSTVAFPPRLYAHAPAPQPLPERAPRYVTASRHVCRVNDGGDCSAHDDRCTAVGQVDGLSAGKRRRTLDVDIRHTDEQRSGTGTVSSRLVPIIVLNRVAIQSIDRKRVLVQACHALNPSNADAIQHPVAKCRVILPTTV